MIKFAVLLIFLLSILPCYGQDDILIDVRDGKSYPVININGTIWMLDNLNLETALSTGLSQLYIDRYNLRGRYYHMSELDSVCPTGWRLPDVQDWIDYYDFMVSTQYSEVSLAIDSMTKPVHYTISNYSETIDLFANTNLLNLKATGRIEGNVQNIPNDYADYWTLDDNEEFKGRTHIHIMNPWTTIHSHKNHLRPKKVEELRKFMVRCVKTDANKK